MTSSELPLPDVDETKCMGYGLCLDHAARYLDLEDDGITRVRPGRTGIAPQDADAVRAAVKVCPANAISWADPG